MGTYSSKTCCTSYFAASARSGRSSNGVITILDSTATTTVLVSPGLDVFLAGARRSASRRFRLNMSHIWSYSVVRDAERLSDLCRGRSSFSGGV